MSNKELAKELHKPIIEKFEKRKVNSPFIDNLWEADLAGMQLTSKFKKGVRFSLWDIDIISKYACVIPLRGETFCSLLVTFCSVLDKKFWRIFLGKSKQKGSPY